MKHPKHRVGDVLLWHPDARDEVYNLVRGAVATLPDWLQALIHEIQQVGSMTWGGATLRSDADFNICLKKDVSLVDYARARRWYYSTHRADFQRLIDRYWLDTGLKIDVGLMDWETDAYNTYVSLSEMKLYHRTDDLIDEWVPNDVGEYPVFIDPNPIDLNSFSGTPPPAKDQHLVWDGYKLRWRKHPAARPWKSNVAWAEDRFASEIPQWKEYYGQHFQEYVSDGNKLVPWRP